MSQNRLTCVPLPIPSVLSATEIAKEVLHGTGCACAKNFVISCHPSALDPETNPPLSFTTYNKNQDRFAEHGTPLKDVNPGDTVATGVLLDPSNTKSSGAATSGATSGAASGAASGVASGAASGVAAEARTTGACVLKERFFDLQAGLMLRMAPWSSTRGEVLSFDGSMKVVTCVALPTVLESLSDCFTEHDKPKKKPCVYFRLVDDRLHFEVPVIGLLAHLPCVKDACRTRPVHNNEVYASSFDAGVQFVSDSILHSIKVGVCKTVQLFDIQTMAFISNVFPRVRDELKTQLQKSNENLVPPKWFYKHDDVKIELLIQNVKEELDKGETCACPIPFLAQHLAHNVGWVAFRPTSVGNRVIDKCCRYEDENNVFVFILDGNPKPDLTEDDDIVVRAGRFRAWHKYCVFDNADAAVKDLQSLLKLACKTTTTKKFPEIFPKCNWKSAKTLFDCSQVTSSDFSVAAAMASALTTARQLTGCCSLWWIAPALFLVNSATKTTQDELSTLVDNVRKNLLFRVLEGSRGPDQKPTAQDWKTRKTWAKEIDKRDYLDDIAFDHSGLNDHLL